MTLNIDTSISLDGKTIVGETFPTVYFDRITIQEMKGALLTEKDNAPSTNSSPSGKFLKIDINVVLKDIYNGKYSTWFKNPSSKKIKDAIKIAVVQTTKPAATQQWRKINSSTQILKIQNTSNDHFSKSLLDGTSIAFFTLKELLGDQSENSLPQKFAESNATPQGIVYSFNKVVSFPSKQNTPGNDSLVLIPEEQDHLCYSAFTYVESETRDLDIPTISKITQEMVILSGEVVRESSVFKTTGPNGGKVWTGEVHYHDGDVEVNGQPYTGYMGGMVHGGTRAQPILDRTIVKNSTIHDLRSLNMVANNTLFKRPVEENKQKNNAVVNNSIFSNLYTSRESNGNIDFTFAVDMNSLVRAKTLDSLNLKSYSINKLMPYINISSVKVYRIKSKGGPLVELDEEVFSTSKPFNPVLALSSVESADMDKKGETALEYIKTGKGYTKEFQKSYLVDRTREMIIEAKNVNGEFHALPSSGDGVSQLASRSNILIRQNSKNIIYIVGTDKSISERNNELYQYEIELEIEDNRSDYFGKLKTRISEQINKLKKINHVIGITKDRKTVEESFDKQNLSNRNQQKFYDGVMNKFTNSFIKDISYNTELINISGDFWDDIPAVYMEAFNLISYNEFPQNIRDNALMTMRNILNPFSGTSDGYIRILEILQQMSDTLSRNVVLSRKNYGTKDQQNTVSKSRASRNNNNPLINQIKINHIFRDTFVDTKILKNFGNVFFKMRDEDLPNQTPGIRVISYEKFVEYKNSEVEKIYSSPNADVSVPSLPNAQMNLDISSYSYFTPSIVYNQGEKPDCIESVLSFDDQYVDMVITGLSSKNNQNLNSNLGSVGKNSLDKEVNSLNGKLDNFFSVTYGTSVVSDENNPKIFKATNNNISKGASLNDVGGSLKKNKISKKSTASKIAKSTTFFKSMLSSEMVLKAEKPNISQFNPEVLSTDCDDSNQVISVLPNQLKALIIAQDIIKDINFSPSPAIRPEITSLINQDPFSTPAIQNIAKNLFQNIAVVQYLSGYQQNKNGNISVKDDIWRPLTKNVFDKARTSNKKLLCRLLPYSNPSFNIQYDNNLPIIDNYFFISNNESNIIMEEREEQPQQSNSLSITLDNPQYQITYYRENVSPNQSPLSQRNNISGVRNSSTLRVPRGVSQY